MAPRGARGGACLLRPPHPPRPLVRRARLRRLPRRARTARLGSPLSAGAAGGRPRRAADLPGESRERCHGLLLLDAGHGDGAVHVPGRAQAGDRGARRPLHGGRGELPHGRQGAAPARDRGDDREALPPGRTPPGFWRFPAPRPRLYEPGNPYETAMLDYYRALDAKIGRLVRLAGEETAVLVVSDHGAKRMDGGICVNEWLV